MSNFHYQTNVSQLSGGQGFPAPDEFQEIELPPPPIQFQQESTVEADVGGHQAPKLDSNNGLPFSLSNLNNNLLSKFLPPAFSGTPSSNGTLPLTHAPPPQPPMSTTTNGPSGSTTSSGNATEPTSSCSSSRTASPPPALPMVPTLPQRYEPPRQNGATDTRRQNGPPPPTQQEQVPDLTKSVENLNLDVARSSDERSTAGGLLSRAPSEVVGKLPPPILSNFATNAKSENLSDAGYNFFNSAMQPQAKINYGVPPKNNAITAAAAPVTSNNQENNNHGQMPTPVFPQRPNLQQAFGSDRRTPPIGQHALPLKPQPTEVQASQIFKALPATSSQQPLQKEEPFAQNENKQGTTTPQEQSQTPQLRQQNAPFYQQSASDQQHSLFSQSISQSQQPQHTSGPLLYSQQGTQAPKAVHAEQPKLKQQQMEPPRVSQNQEPQQNATQLPQQQSQPPSTFHQNLPAQHPPTTQTTPVQQLQQQYQQRPQQPQQQTLLQPLLPQQQQQTFPPRPQQVVTQQQKAIPQRPGQPPMVTQQQKQSLPPILSPQQQQPQRQYHTQLPVQNQSQQLPPPPPQQQQQQQNYGTQQRQPPPPLPIQQQPQSTYGAQPLPPPQVNSAPIQSGFNNQYRPPIPAGALKYQAQAVPPIIQQQPQLSQPQQQLHQPPHQQHQPVQQQPQFLPNLQQQQQHSQFQPNIQQQPQHPQFPPRQQQQHQLAPQHQQQYQQQHQNQPVMTQPYPTTGAPLSVTQQGFNRLWGQDTIDLIQNRHILSNATLARPKITLHNEYYESVNCSPSIIRCTLTKVPDTQSLLQKSRLPLGLLVHPFRDLSALPVIQSPNIVRCRVCRTYINPFVSFVDSKMWKCNLCYRNNELPDDFSFDPMTKTFGDVMRRPEVRCSTIEYIAPAEYMLRPPQPAIFVFLFDVSIIAQQCGYLETACEVLLRNLPDMPGDARAQIAIICYDSHLHFFSIAEGYHQPHEITLVDVDDPFLPRPDTLLVNKHECRELLRDLLIQLPKRFSESHDAGSALGAALQVAYQLIHASGGRITAFQTCLPNCGPGALQSREDPNNRSAKDIAHLNPATDFYKRFALECAENQVAVDLFLLNQQYSDMATISGVSKHSAGCVHHFPIYQSTKPQMVSSFKNCFKRYLTRKIGFESVLRLRCTRGLQVHTFHGNFFVRSPDLLSLPNINPDAGFGMQLSYDESLSDVKTVCFQAALLYTNSDGERRIRVHTLCLPVCSSLSEVMHAADSEAVVGLVAKMAVDKSLTESLMVARECFVTNTVDVFNAFQLAQNLPSGQSGQLIAPRGLAVFPLYVLGLLKHSAFRVGTSTRLDDRVFAMDCMKTLPLDQFMKFVYPEFYRLDELFNCARNSNRMRENNDDEEDAYIELPSLRRLQLSAEFLDSRAIFLMDCGSLIIIYVGLNAPVNILHNVLGISSTAELPDYVYELPLRDTLESEALHAFITQLNEEKPYLPTIQIIRDTSTAKPQFVERLIDDRTESNMSYYEFLQSIRSQVK